VFFNQTHKEDKKMLGRKIIMTHKKLLKAKGQCPDCGGSGDLNEWCFGQDCIDELCDTCEGTGNAIVEEVIPIDVPCGSKIIERPEYLVDKYTHYLVDKNRRVDKPILLPYKTGEKKTFVCDRCEGSQIERYPEPFGLCKKCKGISSEITATVQSIEVKDNNFIVRWL